MGIVLVTSLYAPLASASSADVGIEPAYPRADNERTESIFIMHLKPEEQGKEGIHLVNSGKEAHTVEIYPTDSSSSVDGSFSCRQHAEAVKDVGSWVKLDKTKLTLQAGEQTIVDFTVDVPKGASPGEHDGCIAVQDVANLPAKSGSGVLLGFRSAIRLAVTVPGKIVKQLDILRVEIKHIENRGVSASPIAKNSGNVSLDVTARAQLVSIFGQETDIKSGAKYPIMQGATTGWAYVFDAPYWGGIYKARTSLSYNSDPNSGLGQGESNQQRIRKDSDWFIILPSPLAAAAELAVVVALIWIIITPLRRRLMRRRAARHWQKYVVLEGDTLAAIAENHGIKWKKLAKRNHIKAPYLIKTGSTILVPAQKKTKKMTRRQKKMNASSLEWLSDDQPTTSPKDEVSEATSPSLVSTVPSTDQSNVEWHSPQQELAMPPQPSPVAPKPYIAHTAQHNPLFPEPEDATIPDWRDGASEEELRQFGTITDSSSISQIQNSWSIDEEHEKKPAKKTTKKRSPSAKPRKKPTKKAPGQSSSKK